MKFEITQGVDADVETIAAFQVEMAMESEGTVLNKDIVSRGVRAVVEDASKGRYYVAKADGKVVGSMMLTMEWSDWNACWYWWIQSVYVVPEYRGQGAFTQMYNALREEAKTNNVAQLRLYVDDTNEPALRRYQKVGMHESHYLMYEETI